MAPNIEGFQQAILRDAEFASHFNGIQQATTVTLSNLDRELLRDCLAQSPNAWENFIDRFLGLVIHVVNNAANSRGIQASQDLRDDLVADVFLAWIDRDYSMLRKFRGESSLATYLTVVSRRVVLRRLSQLHLPHTHQSLASIELSQENRDSAPYTQEEIAALTDSIQKLSDHEATAVRMFHLEGKSYREISSHIGMPENSVGPFLSRARDKMKRSV